MQTLQTSNQGSSKLGISSFSSIMSLVRLGPTPNIQILLDDEGKKDRGCLEIHTLDGNIIHPLIFYDKESIAGQVYITLNQKGSWFKCDHQGVHIELFGQIKFISGRGGPAYTFLNIRKELARPGELLDSQAFDFEFLNVPKPYESYFGENVRLSYFLRATIVKYVKNYVLDKEFVTYSLATFPILEEIRLLEVGAENKVHLEFAYNQSAYDLKDTIVGKIYFLLVRVNVRRMLLQLEKVETTTADRGWMQLIHKEKIAEYEILDGAPVPGERIPVRLFLAAHDNLTPTFLDVCNKFSVQYYLNIVVEDTAHRKFIKSQEIILYRRGILPVMNLEEPSEPKPGPSRDCVMVQPKIKAETKPQQKSVISESSRSREPVAGPSWAINVANVCGLGGPMVDYVPIPSKPKKIYDRSFSYCAATQTVTSTRIRPGIIKPSATKDPVFFDTAIDIHNNAANDDNDDDDLEGGGEPGENDNLLGKELEEIQANNQKSSTI